MFSCPKRRGEASVNSTCCFYRNPAVFTSAKALPKSGSPGLIKSFSIKGRNVLNLLERRALVSLFYLENLAGKISLPSLYSMVRHFFVFPGYPIQKH